MENPNGRGIVLALEELGLVKSDSEQLSDIEEAGLGEGSSCSHQDVAIARVIFAGGGTGGHLYPALAVADRLKAEGSHVRFIGTSHGVGASVIPKYGYELSFVHARGLAGGVMGKLKAVVSLAWGLVESFCVLREFRPDLVIGSGGYVCAPVVAAATLLGIPSILMEQNAFAGKSVRLLSRFARRVCTSFPGCRKGLDPSKIVLTGNPVRADIYTRSREEARQRLHIAPERRCLLVTGASQGAASLNRAVLRALPAWREQPWTILHLTGPSHIDEVLTRSADVVAGAELDYRPLAYSEDIAELYAACDLVVCRAGATTLAEITARGLPSVLVPYPYAAENHQEANALGMVEQGAASMVLDKDIEKLLGDVVSDLLTKEADLQAMAGASQTLGRPEAAAAVVQVAHSVLTAK